MTSLFAALAGWPFILLAAAVFLLLIASNRNDNAVGATFTLVSFFGLLYFFGGGFSHPLFQFIGAHWLWLLLGYLPIGVLWMFFKWNGYLSRWEQNFRALKAQFLTDNKLDSNDLTQPVPASHQDAWKAYKHKKIRNAASRPKVSEHKNNLMFWIGYWPVSIIWTLTRGLWQRLFSLVESIYRFCGNALQKMVDRRANKYGDDID